MVATTHAAVLTLGGSYDFSCRRSRRKCSKSFRCALYIHQPLRRIYSNPWPTPDSQRPSYPETRSVYRCISTGTINHEIEWTGEWRGCSDN